MRDTRSLELSNSRGNAMKKIILTFVALAVMALGVPLASSTSADARHYRGHRGHSHVVIIKKKKHHDRGHHRGWTKKRHNHR
jgi:Ni/Co efflux regulator RcnB